MAATCCGSIAILSASPRRTMALFLGADGGRTSHAARFSPGPVSPGGFSGRQSQPGIRQHKTRRRGEVEIWGRLEPACPVASPGDLSPVLNIAAGHQPAQVIERKSDGRRRSWISTAKSHTSHRVSQHIITGFRQPYHRRLNRGRHVLPGDTRQIAAGFSQSSVHLVSIPIWEWLYRLWLGTPHVFRFLARLLQKPEEARTSVASKGIDRHERVDGEDAPSHDIRPLEGRSSLRSGCKRCL